MAPGGGVVVLEDVHFGEGGVGVGEIRGEANGFEEQAERFLGFEGYAI
jgi:hypothetical protein